MRSHRGVTVIRKTCKHTLAAHIWPSCFQIPMRSHCDLTVICKTCINTFAAHIWPSCFQFQCAHFAVHMSILFVPLRFDSHMQDMQKYICCSYMTILFVPMRSHCDLIVICKTCKNTSAAHTWPSCLFQCAHFAVHMSILFSSCGLGNDDFTLGFKSHFTLWFNSLSKCKTCTCSQMTILYFVNGEGTHSIGKQRFHSRRPVPHAINHKLRKHVHLKTTISISASTTFC